MRDLIQLIEDVQGMNVSPEVVAESIMAHARAAAAAGGELKFGETEAMRINAFIDKTIGALQGLGYQTFKDRSKFKIAPRPQQAPQQPQA
jgi:hypothetical protein